MYNLILKIENIWIKSQIDNKMDYRGVIGIPLANLGNEDFVIHRGDRIAQLVFQRVERACFEGVDSVDALGFTDRGDGGFGHTGVE